MKKTQVIIVGGGLAGLYTAYKLQALGISYRLFDAKPVFGGRIAGVPSQHANTKFHDLGPSWIFPHHFLMQQLADELEIELFDQYAKGDVLYQFENIKAPRRINNPPEETLKCVDGGAYSIIRAIAAKLNPLAKLANHRVTNITKLDTCWKVETRHADSKQSFASSHLILAMPPRVIARDYAAASWMDKNLLSHLMQSQTWMAAQAKFMVTYSVPFWREKGLSGQAFSQVGPLVEVHDASISDEDGFALFGFIGMAATQRIYESQKLLKQVCIRQLADIFGHDAYRFEKCYIKDWAKDKLVCTGQDQSEGSRHPIFDLSLFEDSLANNNMYFAGSEFAKQDAGYLEGAIHAANAALEKLNNQVQAVVELNNERS